jgi:hypothetical protein
MLRRADVEFRLSYPKQSRLPEFSWYNIPKWKKIPNDHKIYQMTINYIYLMVINYI